MIDFDFSKSFEYENNFYLTCDLRRLSKLIIHYELLKMSKNIPGQIVEFGVFKGTSFANIATFRTFFNIEHKKIVGFDVFDSFPEATFEGDRFLRDSFIKQAGSVGLGEDELTQILIKKGIDNFEFVKGDVAHTLPNYIYDTDGVSFVNLDTDLYEPARIILEHIYPKISVGGILVLDDYNVFPGETLAVNEYFKNKDVEIQKFPYRDTPYYIIKK